MGSTGKQAAQGSMPIEDSVIRWFEIPVLDMARAVAFYNQVCSVTLEVTENGDHAMAFFPHATGNVGGALVAGPGCTPSGSGTLIYLNAGEDLLKALSCVEEAGGRVVLGKTVLGDAGYFALFIDTEGNKLALHSST
ncbi:MAG: VOC family protein [Planctomycetota bacterium]|nr:VOC family protein [Planctomycetota bacterium]